MDKQEFMNQINSIPREEHIAYKAINQKSLREIFSDWDIYEPIKAICEEDYTNLYYLFLTEEFYKNNIYFIFCHWRGGKFILMQGKEEEYISVLIDTKERLTEQNKHEQQLENIKKALSKKSELLIDSGLRFNDNFKLTKIVKNSKNA